jgi:hypothetical protein
MLLTNPDNNLLIILFPHLILERRRSEDSGFANVYNLSQRTINIKEKFSSRALLSILLLYCMDIVGTKYSLTLILYRNLSRFTD